MIAFFQSSDRFCLIKKIFFLHMTFFLIIVIAISNFIHSFRIISLSIFVFICNNFTIQVLKLSEANFFLKKKVVSTLAKKNVYECLFYFFSYLPVALIEPFVIRAIIKSTKKIHLQYKKRNTANKNIVIKKTCYLIGF